MEEKNVLLTTDKYLACMGMRVIVLVPGVVDAVRHGGGVTVVNKLVGGYHVKSHSL